MSIAKSNCQLDPILAFLPAGVNRSPQRLALAYCCISLITTIAAACIDGRFIHENSVEWNGTIYLIHPLCHNFSTLIDFALLNPLIIMYLLRSSNHASGLRLPAHASFLCLGWFQSLSCLMIAGAAVALYFKGFLQGAYFDAIVAIAKDGTRLITITGWLVFFWTTVILYFLLAGVVTQFHYIRSLLRLRPSDLPYDPLHDDQAGGLKDLAEPALDFFKAMILLFVAFLTFAVYDLIIFHVHESKRLWAIAAYAVTVFPLFIIPIIHLHRLMKIRQRELASSILKLFTNTRKATEPAYFFSEAGSYKELLEKLAAIRELKTWLSTTPAWPLPIGTLLRAGTYMLGVVTPLVPKLMPALLSILGFGTK